jgi:TM2 domain-containing membrane protein YozV/predicted transcriptional regulator
MYSTGIAYLLWFLSGFGALGFHRFYLGKIPTGILWMCTGGLGYIGAIYDLITLPGQVREANIRRAFLQGGPYYTPEQNADAGQYSGQDWRYANDAEARVVGSGGGKSRFRRMKPEHIILKLAKENDGLLTVSEVALAAEITVDEAKEYLDAMVSKGIAELRVRNTGGIVYLVGDFADKDAGLV